MKAIINLQIRVEVDGKWKWVHSERSVPYKWDPRKPIRGVMLDAEGPSHLEGISFMNFKSNDLRRAAAIEWRDGYM